MSYFHVALNLPTPTASKTKWNLEEFNGSSHFQLCIRGEHNTTLHCITAVQECAPQCECSAVKSSDLPLYKSRTSWWGAVGPRLVWGLRFEFLTQQSRLTVQQPRSHVQKHLQSITVQLKLSLSPLQAAEIVSTCILSVTEVPTGHPSVGTLLLPWRLLSAFETPNSSNETCKLRNFKSSSSKF